MQVYASILLLYSPVSTGPKVPCLGNGAICSRLILPTLVNNMKTILYRYVKGVLWSRWSLSENLMSVILDGANLTFKTYHQVLFGEILYVFQMISDIWKVEIFCFLKYMFIIFYVHTWFACMDVCVPDNMCSWCPWKSVKNVVSPVSGIMDRRALPYRYLELTLGTPHEIQVFLTSRSSL